jgi:type I restriction-modification system DNA methylase subunit
MSENNKIETALWKTAGKCEKFIELHEHRKGKISIFGQESNPTTYKPARMNLAIRGNILTPGRYIDFKEVEDDREVFQVNMKSLTTALSDQLSQSLKLDAQIKENLQTIGFEID